MELATWAILEAIKTDSHDKSAQGAHTSTKAARHPHIAHICDFNSQHGDPDHSKKLFSCSLYYYRAVLKMLLKSTNSLFSNGRISDWTVSIVIQITTKLESFVPFTTPGPSIIFAIRP